MIHVAVLHEPYLHAILRGEKTVEARLSVARRDPFGAVAVGDTVYLKQRGARVRAAATIARVDAFSGLTPDAVLRLGQEYGGLVRAPRQYWRDKRAARYASFFWLADVREVDAGPAHPPFHGRGWICLRQAAPMRSAS